MAKKKFGRFIAGGFLQIFLITKPMNRASHVYLLVSHTVNMEIGRCVKNGDGAQHDLAQEVEWFVHLKALWGSIKTYEFHGFSPTDFSILE